MAKDSFWFRHDSNARNDHKMVKLRRLQGLEGIGFYWCLVEALRESENYKLPVSAIEDFCYEFRSDRKVFESICSCGLLEVSQGGEFFSPSLLSRMKRWDEIRAKRAKSGQRGGKAKASVKQLPDKSQAKGVANSSDKKREEEKREDNTDNIILQTLIVEFENDIGQYNCEQSFMNIRRFQNQMKFPDQLAVEVIKEVSVKHIDPNPQNIHSHIINLIRTRLHAEKEGNTDSKPSPQKEAIKKRLENLNGRIMGNYEIEIPRALACINTAIEDGVSIPVPVREWVRNQGFEQTSTGKFVL